MKIVSGSSNKPLAEKIADRLALHLTPLELFTFPDGEERVQVQENVVDQDCVIVQSTNTPVDVNYIELFLIIDALKRSGADNITVVMPYMGYQRQDHVFRDGEAASLEVMIRLLESLQITRVIGVDMHTVRVPDLFTIPFTHLSALSLFAEKIKQNGWNTADSVLVTPDMGGIRRIKIISEMLGDMPYATVVKNRDLESGHVEAANIDPETSTYQGDDFSGKRVMIVDDMVSSGHTIIEADKLLKHLGARETEVFITHPIFSEEAPELLQNSDVEHIFVTDAVLVPEKKLFAKLEILTISDMIADALK